MTEYYTARDMVEAYIASEIVPVAAAAGVSLAAHPDRTFLDVIYVAEHVLDSDAFFLLGVVAGWDREPGSVPAYETPGGKTLWAEGFRQGRKARRWVDRFGGRYGLAVHRDAA